MIVLYVVICVYVSFCPLACTSLWIWPFCTVFRIRFCPMDYSLYLVLVGFISIMLFIILNWYLYIYYYIYFYLFFPCVTEKPGEIPQDIYSGAHKWILLLTWLKNLVKSSDIYFGDCRCSPFLTLIICFISCISLCCYILCPHTISYTHT